MIRILFICLTLIITTPNLAKADPSSLTSSDLMIVQTWLAEHGGSNWRLLHNEMDGKKYQWIITKTVKEKDIWIDFKEKDIWIDFTAGKEIDDNGKVIGHIIHASDQFFTLVIDKKSYTLKHALLGG